MVGTTTLSPLAPRLRLALSKDFTTHFFDLQAKADQELAEEAAAEAAA